jgi:FkbM family methyltransferase
VRIARARRLLGLAKPVLARTLYRPGSVRTILLGPARGLRYRVFPHWGLAPIYGGWEPSAQRVMKAAIRPGDVVYDVGANRGIHTILFARLVGPTGHVYAFEPVGQLVHELLDNVALNGFSNVTPVALAASNRAGREPFFRGHHEGAGHLAASGDRVGAQVEVETIRLDDFAQRGGNRPPTFMKLDIEGAEGAALDGARELLREFKPTILVDLHTPEQDLLVGAILADYGYTAYRTETMSRIGSLRRGWPDPDGIWGQVVAMPST